MADRFLATPSMRRAPIASTRAWSTASNTARPCWPAGCRRRCTVGSWQAILNAIASAWPRTIAASPLLSLRGGSGSLTFPLIRPGRSAANDTSRSGLRAIARRQPAIARLNGSVGESFDDGLLLMLEAIFLSVIPGRAESANPESRNKQYRRDIHLDSGFAATRRPGMTDQLSATLTELSGSSTPKQR